jgi:hypothetical protein
LIKLGVEEDEETRNRIREFIEHNKEYNKKLKMYSQYQELLN